MRDTGIRRKDKRKAKGLSRSRGRPSQPKDVKAGKSSKTGSKTRASKPYWKMTTAELREATKEFDQECIGETFRPATTKEQARFERARKRGRPRIGAGAKTISVTVEVGLLAKADQLAKELRVPRAVLIARGLQAVLNDDVPGPSPTPHLS